MSSCIGAQVLFTDRRKDFSLLSYLIPHAARFPPVAIPPHPEPNDKQYRLLSVQALYSIIGLILHVRGRVVPNVRKGRLGQDSVLTSGR
jgi:hypothetical protein